MEIIKILANIKLFTAVLVSIILLTNVAKADGFLEEVAPPKLGILRITSYIRTPEQQANELVVMHMRGVKLERLYTQQKIISRVLEVLNSDSLTKRDDVAKIVKENMERGHYLSKHLCGKAIDISKDPASKILVEFILKTNAVSVLNEGNHFHLGILTPCK